MERNVMGELSMYRQSGTKPNFSEIGRRHGMSRKTVAKYWRAGGDLDDGRASRGSGFDPFREVIEAKAELPGITKKAVHEFLLHRHPDARLPGYNAFTEFLLCNGLVLLKTYLLTVIMLAHRPRISMSPYLFHPLAIVAVVTSKPLATSHAELNNNCKLKLQIRPTRLFYKTHCLDDQQSHQAFTLNSFPANLRDCLRQLSIMRNQQ